MKIKDLVLKEIKGFWGEEPAENEKGIPVIKTNNLTYEGVINYSDLCYRSIDVNKVKDNFLIKGDLLIEKSGGTKTHSVGYVSYFDGTDNTYVCNNFILGLRINENIVRPKYIFYILKYMYENGYFAHCYKQTTGIQNLKKDLYLDFDIQVPDFQTQDNIINVLDKITTSTTKDQQKLKKYDDLVKSQFIEMFGDRLKNTKHWDEKELKECVDFYNGKAHEQVVDNNGQYILVTSRCIASDLSDFRRTNTLLFPLQQNDITMVMSDVPNGKAFAKCMLIQEDNKFTLNQRICCLRNYNFNPIFLLHLLNRHEYFLQFDDGNSQTNLRKNDLLGCNVIIPPIELQNQFADFVKHIDKLKFTIKQSIEKLELCYKSLMKQYFD